MHKNRKWMIKMPVNQISQDVNQLLLLEVFSDEYSKKRINNTLQVLYSIELMLQDKEGIIHSDAYLTHLLIVNYQEMKTDNCIPVNSKFFDEIISILI